MPALQWGLQEHGLPRQAPEGGAWHISEQAILKRMSIRSWLRAFHSRWASQHTCNMPSL